MIDLERRDKALQYLIDTDERAARAKSYMMGLAHQEKTILGQLVLDQRSLDGTVGEKEGRARNSEEYTEWRGKYENAVADYEIYRNRRNTAELIIELWRSENANKRQGNI